jgi:hypothetical protein
MPRCEPRAIVCGHSYSIKGATTEGIRRRADSEPDKKVAVIIACSAEKQTRHAPHERGPVYSIANMSGFKIYP